MKKGFVAKTFFSSYKVVEQIGQGGSGTVFNVSDVSTNYAMKVLDEEKSGSDKIKRFKNEMNFCYSQNHKNIVKVLDYGVTDFEGSQYLFYIMPLYKCTLRQVLIDGLTSIQKMQVFSDILDGLEFAHKLGVIHRDIKPENIMITSDNRAVISDFGIAHFTEELQQTVVQTKKTSRLANFQYAAPEQRIKDGLITFSTDIYALGLILNEMFTGEIPIGTDYKKIEAFDKEFCYLDEVVSKMIRQSSKDRYQNISDLKKEIINLEKVYKALSKIQKLNSESIIKDNSVDYLVENPPKLINYDWDNGTLTLILDKRINSKWIQAFNNMGGYSSYLGYEPQRFNIQGSTAIIDNVHTGIVQGIINYFKEWMNTTNMVYKSMIENEKNQKYNKEQNALREKISREQERQKVLSSVRI
jgi:serine/threonine protein kinase